MSESQDATFRSAIPLWCSFASRLLGWRPGEFWHATPAELIAALREPQLHETSPPPSRDLIAQLMERDNNG
ncbi:MAG: phage tail assembly chaperone [Erythrobacter sp.]